MGLSKEEAKAAREKIEKYHEEKAKELFDYVLVKIKEYEKGEVGIFELNHIIHIYHRQMQELFGYINYFYPSKSKMPILLKLIEEEEKGLGKWEPKIKQGDDDY
ncbi:MAG: hypothetical protein ACOCUF_03130 [Patescibacteria group bacterium]